MPRFNSNQNRALTRIHDVSAMNLLPRALAMRIMEAIASAIPFDGYRFMQIDPRTLLISRLLDASANDLDPRNEWLSDVYLQSGVLRYIELPELMKHGVSAFAFQESQAESFGLQRSQLSTVTPRQHYEHFHELRSPVGGTLFGSFHANGRWIAAMQAYRREDSPAFRLTDVEFLRTIAPIIGNAIAASLGRERALQAPGDAPGAAGMVLVESSDRWRALTPASERWLDVLGDPGEGKLASAVLAARASIRSNRELVSATLIAPTAIGPARIEASRAGSNGTVAIVITPAGLADPIELPIDWPLTTREREIAIRLVQGENAAEIASGLFVSAATVNWHLSNIYEKIGNDGRSGLLARFFKDVVFSGIAPIAPVDRSS